MDEGVVTGDRDIINDTHIAVLSTPYSNSVFTGRVSRPNQILRINYMEDLFVFVREALKYDKVALRLLNADDVNDLVPVRNLER